LIFKQIDRQEEWIVNDGDAEDGIAARARFDFRFRRGMKGR